MSSSWGLAVVALAAVSFMPARAQTNDQQIADPEFRTEILKPTYSNVGPVVVLDEAHANFHTASGRYKPFADLLRADGYRIVAGAAPFAERGLADVNVLVIANALGHAFSDAAGDPPSAFTGDECDAVRGWVRAGGSLLLIADHAPFGATAATLASRFGVEMGKGYAWDVNNKGREPTTTLAYSRQNGLLGRHVITQGVARVMTFTGQSMSVPPGAVALLKFSDSARESSLANAQADIVAAQSGKSTAASALKGRAQGLAMEYGKGRVVMTGEAAMFSAQVFRYTDDHGQTTEMKMGINVPGNDNRQFLLNVMHWLTRLER
jgi:hypothetical protein